MFSWCVCVSLSICLCVSVCSGYNFWSSWHRNFIFLYDGISWWYLGKGQVSRSLGYGQSHLMENANLAKWTSEESADIWSEIFGFHQDPRIFLKSTVISRTWKHRKTKDHLPRKITPYICRCWDAVNFTTDLPVGGGGCCPLHLLRQIMSLVIIGVLSWDKMLKSPVVHRPVKYITIYHSSYCFYSLFYLSSYYSYFHLRIFTILSVM